MDTRRLYRQVPATQSIPFLLSCLLVMFAAAVLASQVQTNFGRVEVSNVFYENASGISIWAKLFRPVLATEEAPAPGIVYIHGYQNNRETSDAYCIELARRGFVVLNVDAIGRGNSGEPLALDDPEFDDTFGGLASLDYLENLPFVNPEAVGMMGHSIGGEIAYQIGLVREDVKALVISGTAYTEEATESRPANMLMIFGKYDEYRQRMTGVEDFEADWMDSAQTRAAIAENDPQFSVTYGDFEQGTARRVFMPKVTHIQESHNKAAIAEAVVWMREALNPAVGQWVLPENQIWQIKEWTTLIAMITCIAALFPLGWLLMQTSLFNPLLNPVRDDFAIPKYDLRRGAVVNGILMLLYLPLILVIFGFHVYVMPIDKVFPMMIANGIVFWFFISNLIGFFIVRRWYRRQHYEVGMDLIDLGVSDQGDKIWLRKNNFVRAALLALLLFGFAYLSDIVLEKLFFVDFRFIFPFASDLTPYRAKMFLLYLPFILFGFIFMGVFLYGRMRRPIRTSWARTLSSWSVSAILVMTVPLLLQLAAQYVPIFTMGVIPFVGPSSALVGFIINLVQIILILVMVLPLSTWFFQLTGNIYVGAFLNALLVTWMFASSQVIAPIPV
ncbi:MAG: alpha/beta hydrolase [Anaerolineales bacterium]